MAQINSCLKRVFTVFNIFFAVVGGTIIGFALLLQFNTSIQGGENLAGQIAGLFILYIVGIVTMVIAILGAYGAHKESKGSLIVFLACMVLGCLVMLRYAIPVAVVRPQLEGVTERELRRYLPLDDSTENIKNMANTIQSNFHCCGLFSYRDWNNIPGSCLCGEEEQEEGECRTVGYTAYTQKSIYSKTCFPIIMYYTLLVADIMIGVILSLAILAFFGMILSSMMIHQLRHPRRPTVLLTVPTIFAPAPPKYEELDNPPPY